MDGALRRRAVSAAVRRLGDGDYDAMREIRLEGLRLHPECFGADLEIEEAMTREQWLARMATAVTFGGFVGETLGGIAVFARPRSSKTAHTGELGAMYVRAGFRGQGLGDALIDAVVDCAVKEVEQIKLTLNAENIHAIGLYERHGFRTIGKYPNSLRVGGRSYDELIMLRAVSTSD
jgi:ribosomal protein S18 acetylase RimI-like enzyme